MIEERLEQFDAVILQVTVKAATASNELAGGRQVQAVDWNFMVTQLLDQPISRRFRKGCQRQHLHGELFGSQAAGQVNQAAFSTTGLQLRDGEADAGVFRGDSHEVDVSGKNGTVIPTIGISSYTRSVVGKFRLTPNHPEMASKQKNTPRIARCDG